MVQDMSLRGPGGQAVEDNQRVDVPMLARAGAQLQLADSLLAEANDVQRRILQAAAAFDAALELVAGQREAASLQHASGAALQLQLMHEISVLQVALS